uniref:Uncharacterized protein n=1 Tax=Picea sitchensis TaxID=3332 RepID=A9NZ39_PICSI|nr:unknown [Picea sitchensis]
MIPQQLFVIAKLQSMQQLKLLLRNWQTQQMEEEEEAFLTQCLSQDFVKTYFRSMHRS